MTDKTIVIPDLGGAEGVTLIEILIQPGDQVTKDQPIATLEGDKATMEVPCPFSGSIVSIDCEVGQTVTEGQTFAQLQSAEEVTSTTTGSKSDHADKEVALSDQAVIDVMIPDLGGAESVTVIEQLVQVGDWVEPETPVVILEGDKATMDVPATQAGQIQSLHVTVGQAVREGQKLITLVGQRSAINDDATESSPQPARQEPTTQISPSSPVGSTNKPPTQALESAPSVEAVYVSPIVRRLAYECGIALHDVPPTGAKGRITKEDLTAYIKNGLQAPSTSALPSLPAVDFSQFGPVETMALNKIKRATATAMTRSWLNVPHVTQFDEIDITDLEANRQRVKDLFAKEGARLTVLVFILKALGRVLKEHPTFCASLAPNQQHLILKHYVHIGVAVDTPNGLVVPVVRDVDQKNIKALALELAELSDAARRGALTPGMMQGGCMTVSSLGGIGGTQFTPIVNAPEVAILGVSRARIQPVVATDQKTFEPRLIMPVALSYDHRVIDGAEAARMMVDFNRHLTQFCQASLEQAWQV